MCVYTIRYCLCCQTSHTLLNTLCGCDYACLRCVQGHLKRIGANHSSQSLNQCSASLLANRTLMRHPRNSVNLGISQYHKAAWLTNDIEMRPISLVHKIGWRVHPLHLADVKTSIINLQAGEGEGHFVLAGADVALNDLLHTEHFKLRCVGWSTDFSELVTRLFEQSNSNFLCVPNVLVFTHQAGHSLPVGQHHGWLSHFHYCKEVKSTTLRQLSRNDLQSFA